MHLLPKTKCIKFACYFSFTIVIRNIGTYMCSFIYLGLTINHKTSIFPYML